MKLYTIGFTQKTAGQFFELLRQHGVRRVIDVRLRPNGRLSGFARKDDLPYLLDRLVDGCQYLHRLDLAPTNEMLDQRRKGGGDWQAYLEEYQHQLDQRRALDGLDRASFERLPSCLLCSEAEPEQCHRRLLAERLLQSWGDVEIIHL
ncbi:MAG: DUF488 family protein [Chloroflexota bacterium]